VDLIPTSHTDWLPTQRAIKVTGSALKIIDGRSRLIAQVCCRKERALNSEFPAGEGTVKMARAIRRSSRKA
jgi:hypothetical protein